MSLSGFSDSRNSSCATIRLAVDLVRPARPGTRRAPSAGASRCRRRARRVRSARSPSGSGPGLCGSSMFVSSICCLGVHCSGESPPANACRRPTAPSAKLVATRRPIAKHVGAAVPYGRMFATADIHVRGRTRCRPSVRSVSGRCGVPSARRTTSACPRPSRAAKHPVDDIALERERLELARGARASRSTSGPPHRAARSVCAASCTSVLTCSGFAWRPCVRTSSATTSPSLHAALGGRTKHLGR